MAPTFSVTSQKPYSLKYEKVIETKLTTGIDLDGLPQDVPVDIGFDDNVNDNSNAVMAYQDGTIIYNLPGVYIEEIIFSYGRLPGQGTGSCFLTYRAIVNGVNGEPRIGAIINDANELHTVYITNIAERSVGDTIRFQVWTDSQGNTAGGLRATNVTLTTTVSPAIQFNSFSSWQDNVNPIDDLFVCNAEAAYADLPGLSIFSYGAAETSLETGVVIPFNFTLTKITYCFPDTNSVGDPFVIDILRDGVSTGFTFTVPALSNNGEIILNVPFIFNERLSFRLISGSLAFFTPSISISGIRS